MQTSLEVLKILFSGPGATFAICATLVTFLIIFVRHHTRFSGVILGYKDLKVEVPRNLPAPPAQSGSAVAVEPSPTENKNEEDNAGAEEHPIWSLLDAKRRQDRAGIEAAVKRLPFHPGLKGDQVEVFAARELLEAGFADALADLKAAEEKYPTQTQAPVFLARYYLELGALDQADHHLTIAESRAADDDHKVRTYVLRAELIARSNKLSAGRYLRAMEQKVGSNECKATLLDWAGRYFKDDGSEGDAILAWEGVLRLAPDQVETRFRLALLYAAQAPLKALAVRHYQIVLKQQPHHTSAMNNLALLLGELGMLGQRVDFLRRAASLGDGFALGNLANFYVEGGFIEDAEKRLDEAKETAAQSERVISARRQIQKLRSENEEKLSKAMRVAEEFATQNGAFEFAEPFDPENCLGEWMAKGGSIDIRREKEGSYKFVFMKADRKLYGRAYALSPVTTIRVNNKDPATASVLLDLFGSVGEMTLLFGQKVRLVETKDDGLPSWEDYYQF